MAKQATTWGVWLIERARHVGFRRQADVAHAIGCSENQLCRWVALDTPPSQIRKGFDQSLLEVLKVDRPTLFANWRRIAPEAAPIIDANPDDNDLRRAIFKATDAINGERLKVLAATARALQEVAIA